jgi:peptidoglycan hydrolase CwlO-like protein
MEPESREIDLYKKRKKELGNEMKELEEDIWDYKEVIKEKGNQVDMLAYLIAKLEERIDEKEEL